LFLVELSNEACSEAPQSIHDGTQNLYKRGQFKIKILKIPSAIHESRKKDTRTFIAEENASFCWCSLTFTRPIKKFSMAYKAKSMGRWGGGERFILYLGMSSSMRNF
jgi:hypothetical protein